MERSRRLHLACLALLLGLGPSLVPGASAAEATRVTVRVLAKGAKFVGTSMGGARVVLRDVETGRILAEGATTGTTGSTEKIMGVRRPAHAPVATEDAAAFRAVLDLDAPRLVEVEASGPLAQRQSANRVTATHWIVPGRHVTAGDAWLLVLPGFVVDVLAPAAHATHPADEPVVLRAHVTMMCGCPIEPGGLWDASRFEIRVRLARDGKRAGEVALDYAGRTSRFEARLGTLPPGVYQAAVYAWDPENGNTGLDHTTWVIPE